MIATTTSDRPAGSAFLSRVATIHRQNRRVRLIVLALRAALLWACGVGLIAVADYLFELPWGLRVTMLGAVSVVVLALFVTMFTSERRRWRREATAMDIETAFPDLGQRARTAVQFGDRTESQLLANGIRPELVTALVDETTTASAPLPLDDVVPRKRLQWAVGLLAAALLIVALACIHWEWRRAFGRALAGNTPYTQLTIEPGDVTVAHGESVNVIATLAGRTDRSVLLEMQDSTLDGSSVWTTVSMVEDTVSVDPTARKGGAMATFGAGIETVTQGMRYRVRADTVISDEFNVTVLDRLTIARVSAEIESPMYTSLPVRVIDGGAVRALAGSVCRFTVELSRPPASVRLLVQPLPAKSHPLAEQDKISVQGARVRFSLPVERNMLWTLHAETADGVALEERSFRVQATQDRPPKLTFDRPPSEIEVHALAELPIRLRVADDYGLTRAGIVFQISGSDEFTLLERNFEIGEESAPEVSDSLLSLPTRTVLERLLPLEHFGLTEKDSVMYYAFAEDNLPGETQRSESKRRFIDIRPLLLMFRRLDSGPNAGGGLGGRLASLSELIRRERGILNWTIRLDSRSDLDPQSAMAFDRLLSSQANVAELTRTLAEGLQERGIDDVDALYQAEAAMLQAIDSLAVGDLEAAALQENNAQQFLVEGRNRVTIAIAMQSDFSPQELYDFNQRILDRLNQENGVRSEESAAQLIVAQLLRFARTEEDIARRLTNQTSSPAADMNEDRQSAGVDESGDEPSEDAESQLGIDFEALEEEQFRLLADARELTGVLGELESITRLARDRMAKVTDVMQTTIETLEAGETTEAAAHAIDASERLRELVRQIIGLSTGSVVNRIAFSRRLSVDLTRRQQLLADRLTTSDSGATASDEPPPAWMARDVGERGLTLEDVLLALAAVDSPDAAEAVDLVAEIVEERDVAGLRERLQTTAESIVAGQLEETEELPVDITLAAVTELRETADLTERLAGDLDTLHRQLVTPRIEQLRDFEDELAELAEQMKNVEDAGDAAAFDEQVSELLSELAAEGLDAEAATELMELMGDQSGLWGRDSNDARLSASAAYRDGLLGLLRELQVELQELILAEGDIDSDAPVPAQYEPLVERYLKVLSQVREE